MRGGAKRQEAWAVAAEATAAAMSAAVAVRRDVIVAELEGFVTSSFLPPWVRKQDEIMEEVPMREGSSRVKEGGGGWERSRRRERRLESIALFLVDGCGREEAKWIERYRL